MRTIARLALFVCLAPAALMAAGPIPAPVNPGEQVQQVGGEVGQYGGRLIVGQRAEPKTLNPVTATDALSREVIGRCNADLISINRLTQRTEAALAESWKVSSDGRVFTLKLRRGIRFSDGQPFDANDVVFSFTVYLDEAVGSPQRDLLIIDGKPLLVAKVDQYTVRFTLPKPYAAAERIFDGLAILPRHLLEKPYREGHFDQLWSLNTLPSEMAGLGPFRVQQYVPGQHITLERNPYYWRVDGDHHRLPYLDQLVFLFTGGEDQQILRFEAGETDIVSRLSAENYSLLSREQNHNDWQLADLGPSLEYNFLVFNLNDLSSKKLNDIARKQTWFGNLKFRQAVSEAIDRNSIVRLVYGARGTPLWGNVGPGNKLWVDQSIPHPQQSLDSARQLLKSAGFWWDNSGQLHDASGNPVEFSLVTSSSNTQRMKMATLVQDDLSHLGIQVHVVPLDFRAMLDRVFQTFDYDAAIMGLGGGDPDPNPEMNVWLSSGSTHLWHLGEAKPATDWEREIDQLMQQQMITLNYEKRKRLYDRVQELVAENLPFIFLATPDVLVAANHQIANFHPAVLDHYTLWNADQLYLRTAASGVERAGTR
ncbi:MAG TPA: ABC transporter substrate-binding protein [Verrucomicrobiae bacterium]|jgi:peptide/nickel transport system substrate-binding protein|nr:ABC transporter substrate-binding protein [Verrucomicrobiae bacterium]